MAVSPNSVCTSFCSWLLATAWLKITSTQTVLITSVYTAAAAGSTVTDHTWNEFLRTTGLWYQYYLAYIDQTTANPATSYYYQFDYAYNYFQPVIFGAFEDIMDYVSLTCYGDAAVLAKINSIL